MQLYLSLTSPFARKVRVALIEKALGPKVKEIVIDAEFLAGALQRPSMQATTPQT